MWIHYVNDTQVFIKYGMEVKDAFTLRRLAKKEMGEALFFRCSVGCTPRMCFVPSIISTR